MRSATLQIRHASKTCRWVGLCRACVFVFFAFASLAGCARWYNDAPVANEPVKSLTSAKPSPDTVDIETVLVRFSEDQLVEIQQIWNSVDEFAVELDQRRVLDENGLRVGIIRGELPAVIRRQLATKTEQQKLDVSESAGLSSDADAKMRLLRCRVGRRKDIIVRRDIAKTLSIVTASEGQLAGQTFDNRPTILFALTPTFSPEGQAIVELVPEVQYGESQASYVASELGVRQEQRRPSKAWKNLKIRALLEQGNVLAVAATQPPKSLGGSFFIADHVHQSEEHLVLLIRLAGTQVDHLFGEQQVNQARALMERE